MWWDERSRQDVLQPQPGSSPESHSASSNPQASAKENGMLHATVDLDCGYTRYPDAILQ